MKTMPRYDVTEIEQTLIDNIPVAVATKDAEHIIETLEKLYLDEEYRDCLSAMMIIEKYLFRAYELRYFVYGAVDGFEYDEYFFDEGVHREIMGKATAHLDGARAEEYFLEGKRFVEAGDLEAAGELFKQSALAGSPNGAFNYGVTLSRGEGCAPDKLLAAFWYWRGATNGNFKAMRNLAYCFKTGDGVCADEMTTLYWFIRAYLHGDTESGYSMGALLASGRGLPNFESIGRSIMLAVQAGGDELYRVNSTAKVLKTRLEPYIYNR